MLAADPAASGGSPVERAPADWWPDLAPYGPVRYRALVAALRDAVRRGELRPGDRLPTHRAMARRLGVTISTVTQAYAEAARQQLVHGEVGRGTFVRADSADAALFTLRERTGRVVDLSTNVPALDLADRDLDDALAALVTGGAAAGQRYPGPALLGRARGAFADYLAARGAPVPADHVALTAGAQHGLLAALLVLCGPGARVLAEQVTFPGLAATARRLRLRLVPVAVDAEGLVPADLAAQARRHQARVVVAVPALQNPTGATMGPARRAAVAEVLAALDLVLVEDDVYGSLAGRSPLATLAPERSVIVSSLSKSVSAGLRVGFVAAAAAASSLIRPIVEDVHLTSWLVSPTMLQIACGWLADGTAERRAAWQRAEVAARYRLAEAQLDLPPLRPGQPAPPHLWIAVRGRADRAAERAREHGVEVVPAGVFAVGRQVPRAVRLSLTTAPTRQELRTGLQRLRSSGVAGPAPV